MQCIFTPDGKVVPAASLADYFYSILAKLQYKTRFRHRTIPETRLLPILRITPYPMVGHRLLEKYAHVSLVIPDGA
jgi:hypothetical protein